MGFNVALSENDIGNIMEIGLDEMLLGYPVSHLGKLSTTWAELKK